MACGSDYYSRYIYRGAVITIHLQCSVQPNYLMIQALDQFLDNIGKDELYPVHIHAMGWLDSPEMICGFNWYSASGCFNPNMRDPALIPDIVYDCNNHLAISDTVMIELMHSEIFYRDGEQITNENACHTDPWFEKFIPGITKATC